MLCVSETRAYDGESTITSRLHNDELGRELALEHFLNEIISERILQLKVVFVKANGDAMLC